MSNGRSLVRSSDRCHVCGQSGGLKVKCDHEGCSNTKKDQQEYLHITCARHAGLEVQTAESESGTNFYGMYDTQLQVLEVNSLSHIRFPQ
jgi:hypothetical protein